MYRLHIPQSLNRKSFILWLSTSLLGFIGMQSVVRILFGDQRDSVHFILSIVLILLVAILGRARLNHMGRSGFFIRLIVLSLGLWAIAFALSYLSGFGGLSAVIAFIGNLIVCGIFISLLLMKPISSGDIHEKLDTEVTSAP